MEEFIKALTGAAILRNEPMSEIRVKGYLAMLTRIPEDQLIFALRKCLEDSEYFPNDAAIRRKVRNLRNPAYQYREIERGDITTQEERDQVIEDNKDFKKKMGWENE